MKHFLRNFFLFSLPLGLLVFPPLIPLLISGEYFKNLDEEIKDGDPYLVGYAYNTKNYQYLKWKTLESKAPVSVVALGSSRVLQLREQMFNSSFYNAGFTIRSIKDFLPFLKSLPEETYPEYLIIGLDQWMFNPNWENERVRKDENYWSSSFTEIPTGTNLKSVWKDILTQKYSIVLPNQPDTIKLIGLNAYVNQKGMRVDGSTYYGALTKKLISNDSTVSDYEFRETLEKIRKNKGFFQPSTEVSFETLEELERILLFCQANGIKVTAFLPPYAHVVSEKFKGMEGYAFMTEIYPEANILFKAYNQELYDFSEIKEFEGKDEEMIDGFHGGEVTYLKMLIKMLSMDSQLNRVSDLEGLKRDLETKRNNYIVY